MVLRLERLKKMTIDQSFITNKEKTLDEYNISIGAPRTAIGLL